jgi:hypothetical protein
VADETYTDKNGGRWTIIAAPNGQFLATADLFVPGGRMYQPTPPDFDGLTKEIVIGLVELYASTHKGDIGIVVSDRPSSHAWVVALVFLGAVALESRHSRRRGR